ncbi:hypothetical protein GW17_00049797 [Ensete ventricosum]|nr:hypothetical protein GW17_00049797 [Ensete ventricosum]
MASTHWDSACVSKTTAEMLLLMPQQQVAVAAAAVTDFDSSSSLDTGTDAPSADGFMVRSPLSSELHVSEKVQNQHGRVDHKRKSRGEASLVTGESEVRRKKISERMKMLQGLVPGCDKVTGKALILDEIINYVQCLQNQVEVNCK